MLFQKKLDSSLKKLHDMKEEKDGLLTEEEMEAEKEQLDWKDYFAMTISAMLVILPVAIVVLLLMALAGIWFVL